MKRTIGMDRMSAYQISEVLHDERNRIIYRATRKTDGVPVLIKAGKPSAGNDWPSRVAEWDLLCHLHGSGIARPLALEKMESGAGLVLEDRGGISLRACLANGRLEAKVVLRLAIQLAEIIGCLHQNRIIHKDLRPENLLVRTDTWEITLIDAGNAALGMGQIVPVNLEEIPGTWPYLAPEMTGRINQPIDTRADLYMLGVMLYEMLSGQLPLQAAGPIEWVHAHLAKLPPSLRKKAPNVPPMLAAIVMKLLSKNGDDRYQSAYGLKADLEQLHSLWQLGDTRATFPLAEQDQPFLIPLPQKLYGREQMIRLVLDRYRWACFGSTEVLLITGPAGIGKTALVQEIKRRLSEEKGHFISGKFEQFDREVPYVPLVAAFRDVFRNILIEDEAVLREWKQDLTKGLGPNAVLLTTVLPEMAVLLGDLPPMESLPSYEVQHRFQLAFRQLIQVFTRKGNPVILFLDDLQWADIASLQLIQMLLTDPESQSLLVMSAYRDNELSPHHPLVLHLHEIKNSGVGVHQLSLPALTMDHLNQLVADALRCDSSDCQPLTSLLIQKTAGNPFFFTQMLQAIYEEELLAYDFLQKQWIWNTEAISSKETAEDLLSFLLSRLQKLPASTQSVLAQAACLGSHFDLSLLADVLLLSVEQLAADLWSAAREGLVIAGEQFHYTFLHDRIQQAAYSLLDEEQRMQFHCKIGLQLMQRLEETEQSGQLLFELVKHLNAGAPLLTNQDQRYRLMELNLAAGKKAQGSSAFDSALIYLRMGTSLIREEDWAIQFPLCFELMLLQMECEYLCGHFEQAESLSKRLRGRSRNRLERAAVCKVIVTQYVNLGKYAEAISLGLSMLDEFGYSFSEKPSQMTVQSEMLMTKRSLQNQLDHLPSLPEMTDETVRAVMDLLFTIAAPSFFSNKEVYIVLMALSVRLTLQYGLCPASATAFAAYGMAVGLGMDDYKTGFRLGEAAVALADRHQIMSIKSKCYVMFGAVISGWGRHASEGEAYLAQALQLGLQAGDHVFASYAMGARINSFYARKPIEEVEHWISQYLEILAETKDEFVIDNFILYQQWIAAMRGMTESPVSFQSDSFREETFLEKIRGAEFMATTFFQFYTYKTQLYYLCGDYAEAIRCADAARPYTQYSTHLPHLVECWYYESLSIAALMTEHPAASRAGYWERLQENHAEIMKRALTSPENYLHKRWLLEAEMARLMGEDGNAMRLYEQAIASAKENDFVPHIAIAKERAALYYQSRQVPTVAEWYASSAWHSYREWGAMAKAADLLKQFPSIPAGDTAGLPGRADAWDQTNKDKSLKEANRLGPSSVRATAEMGAEIDLATVLKAAQSVSEEMDLGQLIRRLMTLIVQNAGAQKGYCIQERDGQLFVDLLLDLEKETLLIQPVPVEELDAPSEAILRYVSRTREIVHLDDASRHGLFVHDPYIAKHRVHSVLCIPILLKGELRGIFYLENSVTKRAFSEDRLEVLLVLASQIWYVNGLLRSFGETTIAVSLQPKEQQNSLIEPLTERELEVLNLMAAGMSNKEIADHLMIAVGTVKSHVKNIFYKLNVNRRTKAVAEAKRHQLLSNEHLQ